MWVISNTGSLSPIFSLLFLSIFKSITDVVNCFLRSVFVWCFNCICEFPPMKKLWDSFLKITFDGIIQDICSTPKASYNDARQHNQRSGAWRFSCLNKCLPICSFAKRESWKEHGCTVAFNPFPSFFTPLFPSRPGTASQQCKHFGA